MSARVLREIPLFDPARLVAGYQFTLVRVYDDIVDWRFVVVVSLNVRRSWIPDLDGSVFAASNEPFSFVVERDGGYVGSVTLERNQRGGRRASNLVDIDLFVNCSRKEAFTGRSGMNGDGVV